MLFGGFVSGDRGERCGVEPVARCALAPSGDEFVGGGVVLGWSGAQHDVFDLAGVRPSADLCFEFCEGVVDLTAALGELSDHRVGDARDLPAAGSTGPPPHAELGGESVTHLRGRERRGAMRVHEQGA